MPAPIDNKISALVKNLSNQKFGFEREYGSKFYLAAALLNMSLRSLNVTQLAINSPTSSQIIRSFVTRVPGVH